jgi:hypothetical protein
MPGPGIKYLRLTTCNSFAVLLLDLIILHSTIAKRRQQIGTWLRIIHETSSLTGLRDLSLSPPPEGRLKLAIDRQAALFLMLLVCNAMPI